MANQFIGYKVALLYKENFRKFLFQRYSSYFLILLSFSCQLYRIVILFMLTWFCLIFYVLYLSFLPLVLNLILLLNYFDCIFIGWAAFYEENLACNLIYRSMKQSHFSEPITRRWILHFKQCSQHNEINSSKIQFATFNVYFMRRNFKKETHTDRSENSLVHR